MGLLTIINSGPIFIDTAPFIYFVERKPLYVDVLRPILRFC